MHLNQVPFVLDALRHDFGDSYELPCYLQFASAMIGVRAVGLPRNSADEIAFDNMQRDFARQQGRDENSSAVPEDAIVESGIERLQMNYENTVRWVMDKLSSDGTALIRHPLYGVISEKNADRISIYLNETNTFVMPGHVRTAQRRIRKS